MFNKNNFLILKIKIPQYLHKEIDNIENIFCSLYNLLYK